MLILMLVKHLCLRDIINPHSAAISALESEKYMEYSVLWGFKYRKKKHFNINKKQNKTMHSQTSSCS